MSVVYAGVTRDFTKRNFMKSTWKNGTLLATAVVFAMTGPLLAQNTATKTSSADMKFAKEAAEGGMAEVDQGKLAVQKAANEKVKQFGQRMIDDHSKLNSELKSVAAKDNITIPTELDSKQQATINKLSSLSGPAFDRIYIRDQVKDHEKDIAEFQKEASDGSNPDLKNLASSSLPILQEHLRLAKDAETALNVTSKK